MTPAPKLNSRGPVTIRFSPAHTATLAVPRPGRRGGRVKESLRRQAPPYAPGSWHVPRLWHQPEVGEEKRGSSAGPRPGVMPGTLFSVRFGRAFHFAVSAPQPSESGTIAPQPSESGTIAPQLPESAAVRRRLYFAAVSPWGENPARRGGRGIFLTGQNFARLGEGLQGIPTRASSHACTPKRPPISSPEAAQNLRGFRISAAVLRLWQEWHRLCKLPGSVNTAQSPLWSRTWSTSVARVLTPRRAHSRHHGSRRSCSPRSRFHSGVPYIQRHALASSLRSLGLGWCRSQYPAGTSL